MSPARCHPPAEIDSTPLVLRYTLVGVFRFAVLPLPSSPEPLLPQHFAPPAVVTAQVWLYPAEIEPTLLSPDTLTGCLAGPGRSVTELAGGVVAPALHAPAVQQRAGVVVARRDGCDAAGEPRHRDRLQGVRVRAVADLAVRVVAPAHDAAGVQQRAGVIPAGRDGRDAAAEPEDVDRGLAQGARAIAELPVAVVAPTLDATTGGEGATGIEAERDRCDAVMQRVDVGRHEPLDLRAVADLAIAVVAPAHDAATVGQGAGVVPHGLDVRHAAGQPRHADGRPTVVLRAVAQHAGAVEAPALDAATGRQDAGVHRAGGHAVRRHRAGGWNIEREDAGDQADRRDDPGRTRPETGGSQMHAAVPPCELSPRPLENGGAIERQGHTLAARSSQRQVARRGSRPST